MAEAKQVAGPGTDGLFQFPGAFAQNFLEFVGKHAANVQQATGVATPVLPLPEAETMVKLQQEYAERYRTLWDSLMNRKSGETGEPVIRPEAGDRRFSSKEWSSSPVFDYIRQSYLLNADYLKKLTDALPISDSRAKARAQFLTRQYVDAMAPSNFAATNPEFIRLAIDTNGESIAAGIRNLLDDLQKGRISVTDDTAFEVGRNLAVTPGSVIYENELIQLIQYSPQTPKVHQRPLLIVPPCINKFYIMDLQPESSLVRFAVEHGITVFLVSWRNVSASLAHYTWDNYVDEGVLTALDVVRKVTKVQKPNVLGFCVGGTLLTSALAVACGRGEDPVESLTLLTTLLDFSDAGDLSCLVDETSVAAREASIGRGGLLRGQELANVFSSLRANDLVWQYVVGNYLKGGKPPVFDLLYWNADSTNLPGPFLSWYLRNMYLENNLRVPGKLSISGVKVDLGKINASAYLLATREDHIVPWTGAYMVRRLLGGESTFVLGASGHIAGVINPAGKNKRSYWAGNSTATAPEEWLESAEERKGSWWWHWIEWLKGRSGKEIAARGKLGNANYPPSEPAPGRYVKERA